MTCGDIASVVEGEPMLVLIIELIQHIIHHLPELRMVAHEQIAKVARAKGKTTRELLLENLQLHDASSSSASAVADVGKQIAIFLVERGSLVTHPHLLDEVCLVSRFNECEQGMKLTSKNNRHCWTKWTLASFCCSLCRWFFPQCC